MSGNPKYYIRIPRPAGENVGLTHNEDRFIFVRVHPEDLTHNLSSEIFVRQRDKDGVRFIAALGAGDCIRQGHSMSRSKLTCEEFGDHQGYLKQGYGYVGEILGELFIEPVAEKLKALIEALQAHNGAVADEKLGEAIETIRDHCYNLGEMFGNLDEVNKQLETVAAEAKRSVSKTERLMREALKVRDRAIKTASAEKDDRWLTWITAAEQCAKELTALLACKAGFQAMKEAICSKAQQWADDLNPDHDSLNALVDLSKLRADVAKIKSFTMSEEGAPEEEETRQLITSAEELVKALTEHLTSTHAEHTRYVDLLTYQLDRDKEEAYRIANELQTNASTLAKYHRDYEEKRRRWHGIEDQEPFLPYELGSGYSVMISAELYKRALSTVMEPEMDPQTIYSGVEEDESFISDTLQLKPNFSDEFQAEIRSIKRTIEEAKILLDIEEPKAAPVGAASSGSTEPEAETTGPSAPDPASEADPREGLSPELTEALARLYDHVLIGGFVWTGQYNSARSTQSIERLVERTIQVMPEADCIFDEYDRAELMQLLSKLMHLSTFSSHVPGAIGVYRIVIQLWRESELPWVNYKCGKRPDCFKATRAARCLAEEVATARGIDFAQVLVRVQQIRDVERGVTVEVEPETTVVLPVPPPEGSSAEEAAESEVKPVQEHQPSEPEPQPEADPPLAEEAQQPTKGKDDLFTPVAGEVDDRLKVVINEESIESLHELCICVGAAGLEAGENSTFLLRQILEALILVGACTTTLALTMHGVISHRIAQSMEEIASSNSRDIRSRWGKTEEKWIAVLNGDSEPRLMLSAWASADAEELCYKHDLDPGILQDALAETSGDN